MSRVCNYKHYEDMDCDTVRVNQGDFPYGNW
jgi:hypothetical protein